MPFTLKIDADGAITRTGRVGAIIRQLKTLSGKSTVHYNNATRQFHITAAKREFCDATAEAIQGAMKDFLRNGPPKRESKAPKESTRPSAVYNLPKQATPQHSLQLQKQFGRIGRYVKNGCYLQISRNGRQVMITARDSQSVGQARHQLMETMKGLLQAKKASRSASKAPATQKPTDNTGRFQAFLDQDEEEEKAEQREFAVQQREKEELRAHLTQWSRGGGLSRGKTSRSFNKMMHETRTRVAEAHGVEPRYISDREVHQALRQKGEKVETVEKVEEPAQTMLMMTPIDTSTKTTSSKWAQVAAQAPKPVETKKPAELKKPALVRSMTHTTPKTLSASLFTVSGDGWGDSDDEDENTGSFHKASLFQEESAVASSA